eukprot:746989-Hanusia_phi.AAC.5
MPFGFGEESSKMVNSTVAALDKLRASLQEAAMICKPVRAVEGIEGEEFDAADMEEEDPEEGVGVDERAAALLPDEFLNEEEEWYSSARWIMGREETAEFIRRALKVHIAPLYIPLADNNKRDADEIVPRDVGEDIDEFVREFLADRVLRSESVKDVRDDLSAALGELGVVFIPQEFPVYDDEASRSREEEEGRGEGETPPPPPPPLGPFAEKVREERVGEEFDDTEEGWNAWHRLFAENGVAEEDEEEEEEEDEDEDEDEDEGARRKQGEIRGATQKEERAASSQGPRVRRGREKRDERKMWSEGRWREWIQEWKCREEGEEGEGEGKWEGRK